MKIYNVKFMFSGAVFHRNKLFSTSLFNVLIGKKSQCSVSHLPHKNISNKRKTFIKSMLHSEIMPFVNESQLHLLTPLFMSNKHFKIFYKFVTNYDVAKDIVGKILPHITNPKDIVVEANPGLGLITLCLLNSHICNIMLLDKSEIVKISVNRLIEYHQNQLSLIQVNLFKCPGLQITNLIDESVRSGSPTKVIGVITNNTFFINLMYTYIVNELWNAMHHLEFYLVVSSMVWNTIITYRSNDSKFLYHSLFNFMFQFEDLGEYPSNAFFPVATNDKGNLRLVRIVANSHLINTIGAEEAKNYVFFLDILSRSKQTFIIPTLEKYSPNCGPYLISRGVSLSNLIRDFSPTDSCALFNIFKNCDGYDVFKTLNYFSSMNVTVGKERTKFIEEDQSLQYYFKTAVKYCKGIFSRSSFVNLITAADKLRINRTNSAH